MLNLLEEEADEKIKQSLEEEAKNIIKEVHRLELLHLLSGPYDKNNCIIDIHSGAGGTEACDWALMLYRMYTRYIEKKKYKLEVLSYQEGEETGLKSVSFLVKGPYAYGYFFCFC